jgi:hypothetical protein
MGVEVSPSTRLPATEGDGSRFEAAALASPSKSPLAIQYRHFHPASFADWHRFPVFVTLLMIDRTTRNDWMECKTK